MTGDRIVVLRVDKRSVNVAKDQQTAYLNDCFICGRILAVQLIEASFAGMFEIGFQSKREGLWLAEFLPSSLLREAVAVDWPCDSWLVPVVRFPFRHPAIEAAVFTFLFWARLESYK